MSTNRQTNIYEQRPENNVVGDEGEVTETLRVLAVGLLVAGEQQVLEGVELDGTRHAEVDEDPLVRPEQHGNDHEQEGRRWRRQFCYAGNDSQGTSIHRPVFTSSQNPSD